MASPTWAEHMEQTGQLPNGFKKPAPVAVPEVQVTLRPTATFASGQPLPSPYDPEYGAYLLSATGQFFGYYSRYQQLGDLFTVTLYAAISHIRDPKTRAPKIPMIPRLMFLGESGTGKSTDLELLRLVGSMTTKLKVEPTEPAVRSMLGSEKLFLLLDEAEILVGNGNRKANVRAILNASVYPNGTVDRVQGGRRVEEPVYGPVAIAALPYLEVATGSVLETLINRSHIIRKAAPDEDIPQILEDPEGQAMGIRAGAMLEQWVGLHLAEIIAAIPRIEMPPGFPRHRNTQKWKAMMAIAEVAGGMWPDYARHAALGLKDVGSLEDFFSGMARLGK